MTGSPFHQEIFDHRKVRLESEKTSGFVGNEMSLDSTYISADFLPLRVVCDPQEMRPIGLIFLYSAKIRADSTNSGTTKFRMFSIYRNVFWTKY